MAVNQTRAKLVQDMNNALEGAKLVGRDDSGHVCVWNGGYSFTVYDGARQWQEVRHFTDGRMIDWKDEEAARERMEMEGFDVI